MGQALENFSSSPPLTQRKEWNELARLSSQERERIAQKIANDHRLKNLFDRAWGITGALWRGWEKGVNSSIEGLTHGVQWAGKFIGESTSELVQGKEGGFIDKMVRDTAGIRSGLDAVGNFIGTSAGVISESSLSETIHRTGEYWKDTYATTRASLRKKSAEDIVYQVGNVSGMIAVGAVTGYAAKGVQASSILGQEIALSSKLAPIGKWISQTAQLGIEYVWGQQINKVHVGPIKIKNTPSREQIITNSRLNDTHRLEQAEQVLASKWLLANKEELQKLWLLDATGKLTEDAKKLVLAGHTAWKPVFEQDFGSIREKARASEWLPKVWKKELMDSGLMGSEKAAIQSNSLAALQVSNRAQANQIESFLKSDRVLKFPEGSKGKDWANTLIESTLKPLENLKSSLTPEYLAEITKQIYTNLEKQLSVNIYYRLNGQSAWIMELWVKDCFEMLALKGFHLNPEAIKIWNLMRPSMIEEISTISLRSQLSASWVASIERVTKLTQEIQDIRKSITSKLSSPSLTEEEFTTLKAQINAKRWELEKKWEDLSRLSQDLAPLKNTSVQEGTAKVNTALALKKLQDEIALLTRFENGSDIASAGKRLESAKLQKAKDALEWDLAQSINNWFRDLSLTDQSAIILWEKARHLSPENQFRFFTYRYPELDIDAKLAFTADVMKKFGKAEQWVVFNDKFIDLVPKERANIFLSWGKIDLLNRDMIERFFAFNFHLLEPSVRKAFNHELLSKIYENIKHTIPRQNWENLILRYVET